MAKINIAILDEKFNVKVNQAYVKAPATLWSPVEALVIKSHIFMNDIRARFLSSRWEFLRSEAKLLITFPHSSSSLCFFQSFAD